MFMKKKLYLAIVSIPFFNAFCTCAQTEFPVGQYATANFYQFTPTNRMPGDSQTFWYNANGNVIDDTIFQFNGGLDFTINRYTHSEYDSNGKLTLQTLDYWNSSKPSKWSKRVLVYNPSGLLSSDTRFLWDNSSSQYKNNSRDVYVYNQQNQLVTKMYQDYQGGFVTLSQEAYTYYTDGKMKSKKNSDFSQPGTYWLNTYFYNANGLLETDSSVVYDPGTKQFYNYQYRNLIYDASNRISRIEFKQFQPPTNEVVSRTIDSLFYLNNDLRSEIHHYKSNSSGKMLEQPATFYTYENNYSKISKCTELECISYYYHQSIAAIEKTSEDVEFEFYPNPATSEINVSVNSLPTELTIYDLSGRILIQQKMQNFNEKIDIQFLAPGTYVISLNSGSSQSFGKLIRN
ncbi:MAG: T9SS type A sorting domain-containing protein [Bacteroidetes bacterium]|nr:T9SS type A sorting domain-containing protein [Bacteroidota bacterium]